MTKAEIQRRAIQAKRDYRANCRLKIAAIIGLPVFAIIGATIVVALVQTHHIGLLVIGALIVAVNVKQYFKRG